MRKKLLSNNLTGSISKGGVLYRAGEIPTLTTEQKEQAKLVSRLPNDFPFADWEGMTTKQQLRQMQYSGLNAQEQWSLLNTNIPLVTLNEHNHVQTQSESAALAVRVAASLVNATAKAAAAKAQAAVGKPTVSTSLQNAALNGQLGGAVDALSASLKATSSSGNTLEQKSGSRSAKLGGSISIPTRASGQSPSPTPTPTPSQTSASASSPNETPQPEPAPSPESTPNVGGSTQNNGANVAANTDTAYQKDPIEYLFGIDTTLLSEESRNRLYYISRKFYGDGVVPPGLYSSYLYEIGRIKEEVKSNQEAQKQTQENAELEKEKAEYFNIIKSGASPDVTWGTEMIYDQSKYKKISGTFGPWGNIPEKVCGAFSIHNLNQILGIKTRLDELLLIFNRNALLTTNLFGALGVRPGAIEDFYKAAGLEVTRYDDPAKVSKEHDGYIVKFLYPNGFLIFPGGHYVAAEYDKKNDCFYVYNNFVHDGKEKWETLSPSSYKASADRNNYNGKSFGWTIWGIDKPEQPQVKEPQHKTKATTVSKGKWIGTNK